MADDFWVRVVGDGIAYTGKCLVHLVIFWPDDDADYADIYDGLDAISGKKFCRIETPTSLTWHFCFPEGVPFDRGIFVDGIDGAVETTILFHPID